MVVRLYGTVNTQLIEFKRTGEDTWEATIPRLPRGVYFVSLTAEDEAGNQGHYVDLILTYDPVGMTLQWIELSFRERLVPGYVVELDKGFTEILCNRFVTELCKQSYTIEPR
jgi:hypothetical protein